MGGGKWGKEENLGNLGWRKVGNGNASNLASARVLGPHCVKFSEMTLFSANVPTPFTRVNQCRRSLFFSPRWKPRPNFSRAAETPGSRETQGGVKKGASVVDAAVHNTRKDTYVEGGYSCAASPARGRIPTQRNIRILNQPTDPLIPLTCNGEKNRPSARNLRRVSLPFPPTGFWKVPEKGD